MGVIVIGYILSLIGAFTLGGWAARGWYAIADRLDARRKRIAAERVTWAESVTKQTKPPPIVQPNTAEIVRRFEFNDDPLAQDSTLPSPTAPASARKVRRVTKRRK